jgi:nucleoside-diphosphate-sugar epimerase
MKALITRATGYIGFNVATALHRAGHEVLALRAARKRRARSQGTRSTPRHGYAAGTGGLEGHAAKCSVLIPVATDYQAEIFALERGLEVLAP